MKGLLGFYMVEDTFTEDVVGCFPAPNENAAVLAFYNSKKALLDKGFKDSCVRLVHVVSIELPGYRHSKECGEFGYVVCTLANVDSVYQDILNNLGASETLPGC